MGLLSQALPGLRDFRTPLAVGALWALVAVVVYRLLPTGAQQDISAIGSDLEVAFSMIPSVALGSFAALGIYLLGVAMTQVGSGVSRVLNVVASYAIAATIAFIVVANYLWRPLLLICAIILLVLLVLAWITWRSGNEQDAFRALTSENARYARSQAVRALLEALDTLASTWSPEREQIKYVVQQDLERRVGSSPALLQQLIARLTEYDLAKALRLAEVPIAVVGESLRSADTIGWHDAEAWSWAKLHEDFSDRNESRDEAQILRRLLFERLKDHSEERAKFLQSFTDTSAVRGDAARRLEEARVRLRVDQPALHDEYDRLRAEGEFRSAVALPISALFAVAGLLALGQLPWLMEFGQWTDSHVRWVSDVAPWVNARVWAIAAIVVLALVPLILFARAGRDREAEALRLLYASVRQDVIKARDVYEPPIEDIRVEGKP